MRAAKLCLLCFLAMPILAAIDVPPAPAGFTWQEIPEVKSAFLRPSGWYFKAEKHSDTLSYFITKEDIDRDGSFKTGLTINVFKKLKKGTAVEEARKIIGGVAGKWHADVDMLVFGQITELRCLATVATNNVRTVTYNLAVANPKTNTLYVFIFESPESEWDSAWKTGEAIMGQLAIDGEILPGTQFPVP